jgi:RNA polymerase sigma-70 factor (ECF subfamily)
LDENQAALILVRRCVAGDAAAWEELVRQHQRRIYSICYRFTGSAEQAEDLTQEVFIRLYRVLDSFDPSRAAFLTWLVTLTRNLLVDHFRRSRPDRLTDSLDAPVSSQDAGGTAISEQMADPGPGPQRGVERREVREQVQQALGRLSPDLREAVILRDLEDMDYREIAVVLKVPEGTVKSRINRGRTELARLLARTYRQVM